MKESVKKIYSLLPEGDHFKLGILFFLMLFASLLALIGIGTVPVFVLAVMDADKILTMPYIGPTLEYLGITTPRRLAIFGSAFLLLVYLQKNLFMVFYDYLNSKFMLNRSFYLQNRLFRAYMHSPYTFFISRNSSELLRNISSEARKVLEGTLKPILLIALNSIMTTVIVGALIVVEPLISGLGIILFGSFSYLFLKTTKNKMSSYGSESLGHRHAMNKAVLQGLGGFKDAKVLKRETHFLDEFEFHSGKHRIYDLWRNVLNNAPQQIIEMIALTGILFIALMMVLQGRDVSAIVPAVAMFGAAVMKIKPSIFTIIQNVNNLQYNIHSVDAIYHDLNLLERDIHKTTPKRHRSDRVLKIKNNIELKNLDYSYPDSNERALKDVSITVPKNRSVAFVGPSGAGKTTIVDVILGLLEPSKGHVFVDGKNIKEDLDAWQINIGYIPQFIYLLDDTIKRNICFGIPDQEIDEEQFKVAIETAQLKDLINSLDKGDQTIVGEHGIRLSGGQRQRIGIARAIYNNPQVLIMDEATSALDNITEKHVVRAIEKLKGDKTIIMIAHRLTTVQNCDIIYMMKDGRVIGEGNYSELLETNEEFREMSLIDQ